MLKAKSLTVTSEFIKSILFVPSLSKVFPESYSEAMKVIIQKIGYDIDIVELEIPEDHIHMVVRSEPKMSPSQIMQVIKSISARESFKLYSDIKRRYF